MNERIRELWSQAGGHYNGGNQHTWPEYTIDDPEKFAELIVRKCINIVDTEEFDLMTQERNYRIQSTRKIRGHYGVGE